MDNLINNTVIRKWIVWNEHDDIALFVAIDVEERWNF